MFRVSFPMYTLVDLGLGDRFLALGEWEGDLKPCVREYRLRLGEGLLEEPEEDGDWDELLNFFLVSAGGEGDRVADLLILAGGEGEALTGDLTGGGLGGGETLAAGLLSGFLRRGAGERLTLLLLLLLLLPELLLWDEPDELPLEELELRLLLLLLLLLLKRGRKEEHVPHRAIICLWFMYYITAVKQHQK